MAARGAVATIEPKTGGAMTQNANSFHVVVAGAGVAGLETALALRSLAADVVSVEIVSPETQFTYRPLAVAEPFRLGEVRRFDLAGLVRAADATLRRGTVVGVDADRKVLVLEDGSQVGYDALVLTLGARAREAVAGAITFSGPDDIAAVAEVLERATSGALTRIAFAIPAAAAWPLPLYELALLTAEYLTDHVTRGVEVVLVTPEDRPLTLFGPEASDAIRELLEIRGVRLVTGAAPVAWDGSRLHLAGAENIEADAVVALPRLVGPPVAGLPQDGAGFVATDEYGWVLGLSDVYAAGDLTQFPVKQGGIATQQADAVASAIAADAGAAVRPSPVRPVLRGLLLTGMAPRFIRSEPGHGPALVDTEPLWWPPAKIVGRYLTPFLADHLGLSTEFPEPAPAGAVSVEVEVDTRDHATWSSV
jgi:sulfide:quinone oxidoreductase